MVNWHGQIYPDQQNPKEITLYCQIIDHISGTVTYYMVVSLQINKIAFEKSENLEKKIAMEKKVCEDLEKNPGKLHIIKPWLH